ncbi:MAG TPA: hypothetical protein ENI17_08370 [Pseudomonas xinjiangensis]|uniref:Uncharacterized protein n=2 Tax=root TaxID=1 RepID=A0A7V1FSJ1_9GAMM|nr:hypothetical protein [Halopseudomonas xinjiangensis]HEC47629.1 hypothetical protein [Halopseudomonas xinjiangensis]
MTATVYLLLAVTLCGLAFWVWSRRSPLHNAAHGALVASLVGLFLAAASTLMILVAQWGLTGDVLAHAQRMLGLAAQHLSMPLIGLAALFLARGLAWNPSIWGKIILGGMAFFELSRYLDVQQAYHWLVNMTGLGALLIAGLLNSKEDRRVLILCLVAVASVLAPALIHPGLPLAGLYTATHHASWLIPGFVASGLAVGLLAEQAHNSTISLDQNLTNNP